ncbi:unnamed protein product [Symbiodinium pilosum]|uniref:Uncharacterized protein n=1 Tax=Symbiodinium pilosum TaxID=2952 RepID=A0A812W5Z2_SYMPI|nr:unnamed protein product [Symbiodinium pilosum]
MLGLAALPTMEGVPSEELIRVICTIIEKEDANLHTELVASMQTNAFFAALALDLAACEDADETGRDRRGDSLIGKAVEILAFHSQRAAEQSLREEMEVLAQVLLALAVRVPEAKIERLGFGRLVRVYQREVVRKAADLGSGFSRCAAYCTAAVWPWRKAWLQPWFLEEVQRFRASQGEVDDEEPGLWDWLDVSMTQSTPQEGPPTEGRDFSVGIVPWPGGVAWYLQPQTTISEGAPESALLRAYGPEVRVMGWSSGGDGAEQEANIPEE